MTTAEEVLQQLDELAAAEHSLCVEYLSVHCALGHDLAPAPEATGERVADAAAAALRLALSEMSHLLRVNGVLTLAGRGAQLGRAPSIELVTTPELERLLDRELEIARAVDQAYDRVCEAASDPDLFEGELQGAVAFLLEPCPDHSSRLDDLRRNLDGIPHEDYLRATPREPRDAIERALLEVSDAHYGAIVATVRAWAGHEGELGGELRGRAISAMDNFNAINALLVQRGLLPRFTLPVTPTRS